MDSGMAPVNKELSKIKVSRLVRFNKTSKGRPMKLLLAISNRFKFRSDPSCVGSDPVMKFELSDSS